MTDVAHHHAVRTHKKSHLHHYKVQNGDSWWSIAHQFQVDWNTLAAKNHMTLGTVLHPGMQLVIPASHGESTTAATSTSSSASSTTTTTTPSTSSSTSTSSSASSSVSTAGESSFEACVIERESGGDPDARNGQYWGLFQFSEATWVAYGGNAAAWGSAPAAEQEQVFANAVARGGESNWAPYDGC